MSEWAFSQLYVKYGQRILHEDFIEEWKRLQSLHISNFSSNLLLCVFRHCRLEDTKSIMRVCSQWFAATQLREYWMPFIRNALQEKRLDKWVNLVNPFLFQTLSLREKVGWLFSKRDIWEETARDAGFYCLIIPYSFNMEMTFIINDATPTHLSMSYTNPRFKESGYVQGETWFPTPEKSGMLWQKHLRDYKGDDDPTQHISTIFYKLDLPEPMFYEGEGVDNKPHGKGVWRSSFEPNSTIILQGDRVAWDGLPHGVGIDGEGRTVEYWAGERVERDEETNKRRKVNLS